MAKSKTTQRKILKLEANELEINDWVANVDYETALTSGKIISLGESELIRMLDQINGRGSSKDIFARKCFLQSKIKTAGKDSVKQYYDKLKKLLYLQDIISIHFDTKKQFYKATNRNTNIIVNGKVYVRLVGTPNGVKTNSVLFIHKELYPTIIGKINNGANIDKMIPAKLEAYRSLVCSATTPVTNTCNVVICDDYVSKFRTKVTYVDKIEDGEPLIVDIDDYELTLEVSDGFGLISPRLSQIWNMELTDTNKSTTGFCIRNSYLKGMVFTFDFAKFGNEVAQQSTLTDCYGKVWNVEDVDLILPKSVFKLWSAYENYEQYSKLCVKNGYTFSVSKVIENKNDNVRTTNYQFIQSLQLDDKDVHDLVSPTINEYKEILSGDYHKLLLFASGGHMNVNKFDFSDVNFLHSIFVCRDVVKDPFILGKINDMMAKKIRQGKLSKIKVKGNFSVISGDPYGFAEFVFGMDEPKGLLQANEFYSHYWHSRGIEKVAAMRAPMTVDANYKKMNIVSNPQMTEWYKYMKNCIIFNSWDATCNTLNGADKDGDTVFTTSNEIIYNGIPEIPPIVCSQGSVAKTNVTEGKLRKSNADGFNGKIGEITNYGSVMTDMLHLFDKGSEAYNKLYQRCQYTMKAQQDEIDSIKGVRSEGMPSHWFSYYKNLPEEGDSAEDIARKVFNIEILANRKPYFFIYNYEHLHKEYQRYKIMSNWSCWIRFGMPIKDLMLLDDKTSDMIDFIKYYEDSTPVSSNDSVCNKICWEFEKAFDNNTKECDDNFDYNVYISGNTRILARDKREVSILLKKYNELMEKSINNEIELSKEDVKDYFMSRLLSLGNIERMTDVLIEMCYGTKQGKQFVWDMCAEQIFKNLLKKNNGYITVPIQDETGQHFYNGNSYRFESILLESGDTNEA